MRAIPFAFCCLGAALIFFDFLDFPFKSMTGNLKHVKSAEAASVHCLPCKIRADDHADVKSFFTPKIRTSSDGGRYMIFTMNKFKVLFNDDYQVISTC